MRRNIGLCVLEALSEVYPHGLTTAQLQEAVGSGGATVTKYLEYLYGRMYIQGMPGPNSATYWALRRRNVAVEKAIG